jgi:hypothetical protein
MTALFRFLLRVAAMAMLAATSFMHAQQSMMLRNNNSPAGGVVINRGDFNHDGILDLITIADGGQNQISVYFGRADGTFAQPVNTTAPVGLHDLAVGDFNGDGKLDIAVTDVPGSSMYVYLGNGDGTFTLHQRYLTDQPAVSITTSDFNVDGKMDLAIGESFNSDEIEILEGDGAGNFSLANKVFIGNVTPITKVRVGDFNRDGMVDIAVLQTNGLFVLYGNNNFTFDGVLAAQFGGGTNDMNTGDFNQDGFTDILVSWFDSSGLNGGVDVFFGQATRTGVEDQVLIFPQVNPTFESPRQMIAADFDGDGINDIVGLDNDGTFANGVYVWHCSNTGFCDQEPTKFVYTTDRDKFALVAGDFNRDGKIDFAATRVGNSTLEVLLNATPRAACQENTGKPSMTVCQPVEATFSRPPLRIVAKGNSSNPVTDINVYIDNILQGQFAASSIDKTFNMTNGEHFVVVKGFDSTGASFRSDRHVTIYTGSPGQTCATSSSALSINVCLPAQNATLHSPVQIFANSYSPRPITAIQVYIDNQLEFNDLTATEVNKLFPMSPGMHFIVVKAWDATGVQISDSRTITVN